MPVAVHSLAAAALALVFLWSGVAKLARLGTWRSVLEGYRLPASPFLVVMVPAVEIVVPALVAIGRSQPAAALALALLGGFSAAIVRARALQGDRLPCGCFGGADARDYRLMLARNASLALLAATVIAAGRDLELLEGVGAPGAADVVPAVLVGVGLFVMVWMFRSLRGAASDASSDLRRGGR